MLCQRCKGLLVQETWSDLRDKAGRMCQAIRCVNCGNVEDYVVRANRLHPPPAQRVAPLGMVRNGNVVFSNPL